MKVLPLNAGTNVVFKRKLSKSEEKEMVEVQSRVKELLGNNGNSVLIVHDACLPQSSFYNTGVANLLGKDSERFFDFAKKYFGINTIQVFPQGEFISKSKKGMVCPYSYSALGLNDSLINPEVLTNESWHKLMTAAEFKQIVKENSFSDRGQVVNYENINAPNSAFQKNLKNVYNRFLALKPDEGLRVEFEMFKRENEDWLTPKAVYSLLKKEHGGQEWHSWRNSLDKHLYDEGSRFSSQERSARIADLLNSNKKTIDFFKFKQFLAEKHLAQGREKLHRNDLKLWGDMMISFSPDEMWAYPQAFLKDWRVGANDWCAACLDYYSMNDANSAAVRLLKRKAGLMAQRYDGFRVDASWMYINPQMINKKTRDIQRINLGNSVLQYIEDEVKRVQGEKFSPQNIVHEFKAGFSEFTMLRNGTVVPEVASRVAILESEYLGSDWGHFDFYKSAGFSPDGFIMGVGDHTAQPLSQIALGMADTVERKKNGINLIRRDGQSVVLSQIFGDTVENLSRPAAFIRAKFGDVVRAKHNFFFFMDALGRTGRFDAQGLNGYSNYRFKIFEDFKDLYHLRLQQGLGLNLPDALACAMEKEGLHETNKDLYEKLVKFADILKEKEGASASETLSQSVKPKGHKNILMAGAGIVVIGVLLLALRNFNKQKQG